MPKQKKKSVPVGTGTGIFAESVSSSPKEVVAFDQSSLATSTEKSFSDFKLFMNSNVSKALAQSKETPKPSKQDQEQDEDDDQKDKELVELLRTSRLIEEFNVSEMTGRERRKYYQDKLVELGAKKTTMKAPLPIKIGMKQAAVKRTQKRIQEAKNLGLLAPGTKSKIQREEGILTSSEKRARKKKNVGLYGSIGTIKDGIMHVSKKQIRQVERLSSSSQSGKRRKRN